MKRAVVLLVLVVAACSRPERPAPPPVTSKAPPVSQTTTRVVVPKPRGVSTPARCAGDGSYGEAVECFRMAAGLRFHVTAPGLDADGTLRRPRIGEEQVTIGEWHAATTTGGIVWTRGGRAAHPTPELERLYQRLTLYLDPQKKEGSPQLAESDATANHYRFTDANNGEAYEVTVAKDDGRIVELRAGSTRISVK